MHVPYGTNMRRVRGHACPITKKSEMCFKGACHRFGCQLGPYGTNMRHARGHTSPITMKSERRFILARHRFNCRLESLCH
jgi:hypothetical protein